MITGNLLRNLALALGAAVVLALPLRAATPSQSPAPQKSLERPMPERSRNALDEVIRVARRHLEDFRRNTPLSADQKRKVKSVLEAHRAEIRAEMKAGAEARREFQAAVKTGDADPAVKRNAAQRFGQAAREGALLFAKISGELRPALTGEQQRRLEAARTEIECLIDRDFAAPIK